MAIDNMLSQSLKDIQRPNITNDYKNPAYSPNASAGNGSKKETKSEEKKSTPNIDKLNAFIQKYNEASAETKKEIKNRLEADSVFSDFIKKFRSSNVDVKERVIQKLTNSEGSAEGFVNALRNALSVNNAEQQPTAANPAPVDDTAAEEHPSQEGPGSIGYNTKEDVYEYTYAPGDTFGQVLIKMGLSDGRNLWGPNGDVAYYTKQLNDQGIYGNIPIGKTIKLTKRK